MEKDCILRLRKMFSKLNESKKEPYEFHHRVVFNQFLISGYIHALYDLEVISYHTLSKIDEVIFR